jgi:hypothetical protein
MDSIFDLINALKYDSDAVLITEGSVDKEKGL